MSSSLLEIIQLPNGEFILQRADGEGEPLVNIRFSDESMAFMEDGGMDVARIMIQAGIQAAMSKAEGFEDVEAIWENISSPDKRQLH